MLRSFVAGTMYVLLLQGVGLAQTRMAPEPAAAPIVDFEKARRESVLRAVRIDTPIVIDARLDEPAWQLAPAAANFIQVQPYHALPAIEQTEVRILYDTNNLYVGVMCYDSQPN